MSRNRNRPQGRAQSQNQSQSERAKQRALEILDCEAVSTPDELLDLIHDINPTARGLPREEEATRYEIKSRLQSYLLRHFPHEIQVQTAHHRDRKVISLEHRHTWRNACHTVLDSLDEDARAWVQAQLAGLSDPDEDAAALAPPPGAAASAAPPADRERDRERGRRPRALAQVEAGPLLDGLVAQASYDYEAARGHFQEALSRSEGGAKEAVALLRLLIDHLAADADALALIPALSREALARDEARLLLAIAAAREEDEALALEMIAGISGSRRPREAVVHLLLCRAALRRRELALADEHLTRARERDPIHPEIPEVRDEIARARADERLPLEQRLAGLCAAGDYDAAEAQARALLARWPESDPARRALRAITEHRRVAEAQRLRAQAEEAARRGQRGAAMSLLQQALATGLHGDLMHAIRDELARLEQEEQAQRQQSRVSECAALLQRGDLLNGLLAFGALPPSLREEVEARAPQAPFALLREVEKTRCAASPRDIVEATCALQQAQQLAESDPGAALSLLVQHARPLEHVPLRKAVERAAQEQIVRHFHACVREHIEAAHGALGEGDLGRAQALLAELDLRLLPPEDLSDAEALKAAVDLVVERRQLTSRFVALLLSGNLFGARGLADQILARHPDFGPDFWRRQRARVVDLISRAFAVRVHEGPGLQNELCDFDNAAFIQRDPLTWVWAAGKAVVLADCDEDMAFIRLLDPDTRVVRRRAWICLPEPLGLLSVHVDDESVWLLGKRGQVLQLSLPEFQVLRWYGAGEILDPSGGGAPPLHAFQVAPGSRFLWMLLGEEEPHRALVSDVDHLHLSREIGERRFLLPIPGAGEFEVCCCKKDDVMVLHTGRGTVVRQLIVPGMRVEPAVAAHPAGPGLLFCCRPPAQDGLIDGKSASMSPIHCFGVAPDGTLLDLGQHLAGIGVERYRLVTSGSTETSYLRLDLRDGTYGLCCLRWRNHRLEVAWGIRAPFEMLLLRDGAGKHAIGLSMTEDGLAATRLTGAVPELPGNKDFPRYTVMGMCGTHRCGRLQLIDTEDRKALIKNLDRIREWERDGWIRRYLERHQDEQEMARDIVCVVDHINEPGTHLYMVRKLHERFPRMGEAAILVANSHVSRRDGAGILKALRQVNAGALPSRLAQHVHHLRTMAYLWQHRYRRARASLRKALRCVLPEGTTGCSLVALRDLLEAMPARVDLADLGPQSKLRTIRQIAYTVRLADQQMEGGDALEAWHALERRTIWGENELQSLARLVHLYLRVRPGRPELDFRKAQVFTRFMRMMSMDVLYNHLSLRIPGHTWPRRRLQDLVAQARAWLLRMRRARVLDCAPEEVPEDEDSEGERAVAEEADPPQGHVEQQQQHA